MNRITPTAVSDAPRTDEHSAKIAAYHRRGIPTRGEHPGTWNEFAKTLEREINALTPVQKTYTVDQIGDYFKGWLWTDSPKEAHSAIHNGLNQLRDGEDGIEAVTERTPESILRWKEGFSNKLGNLYCAADAYRMTTYDLPDTFQFGWRSAIGQVQGILDGADATSKLLVIDQDADLDDLDGRLVRDVIELQIAAKIVLNTWESGDLAAAVRNLADTLERTEQ